MPINIVDANNYFRRGFEAVFNWLKIEIHEIIETMTGWKDNPAVVWR